MAYVLRRVLRSYCLPRKDRLASAACIAGRCNGDGHHLLDSLLLSGPSRMVQLSSYTVLRLQRDAIHQHFFLHVADLGSQLPATLVAPARWAARKVSE